MAAAGKNELLLFGSRIQVEDDHLSTSTSAISFTLLPLVPFDVNKHHDQERKNKKWKQRMEPERHAYGLEGLLCDIGATCPTSICTKPITKSDINNHQNRLLLPKKGVEERLLPLLTKEEKERVKTQGGIPSMMGDVEGRRWERCCFSLWKSKSYILNGDLARLAESLGLSSTPRDSIEVKAFRNGSSGGDQETQFGFIVLHQKKPIGLLDLFK